MSRTSFAASNSTFNQTINSGTLVTDIKDNSHNSVSSPSITMSAKTFSYDCLTGANAATGTFGSDSQRIYVTNPSAAPNGWTLTLAATGGPTTLWSNGGATNTFAFNNPSGSGCTLGSGTKPGQLTIDPSVSTLAADCLSCTTAGITKGSSTAFVSGTTNSVTLLNASNTANGRWYLTGVGVSQTVPAEQPADSYSIGMTLTATAL